MRVGIVGYGNLGRAVETVAREISDVEICGIYTRRSHTVRSLYAPVYDRAVLRCGSEGIDALILALGSSRDLPEQTASYAEKFNTVDTFDTHSVIKKYKDRVDESASRSHHTSLVCFGWDPGLLSVVRLYLASFLPSAVLNTFWGGGVSQGHSEALRRINGVIDAVEVTVPRTDALSLASLVRHPMTDTERHRRICYICAAPGYEESVRREAVSMEGYFRGYETEVYFVDADTVKKHREHPTHRGRVYALGKSGMYGEHKQSAVLDLDVGSNPELTAHIALASARAAVRLSSEGRHGAFDIFDIPPRYFLPEMLKNANNYL